MKQGRVIVCLMRQWKCQVFLSLAQLETGSKLVLYERHVTMSYIQFDLYVFIG
jgi:hypothetical protein